MRDSNPFQRIPIGIGNKLPKLMGKGRKWQRFIWNLERFLLKSSHIAIMFPPKFVLDLRDFSFTWYLARFKVNMKHFELFDYPNLIMNHYMSGLRYVWILASSATSERIFSTAGRLLEKWRTKSV